MTYTAYVPPSVQAGRKVHVLYLLHGLFGSSANWFELTDLFAEGTAHEIVIAMPDAGDHWYTDSAQGNFETVIVSDLQADVESELLKGIELVGRSIAGISMGGYGAIKLALRYPDRYASAASFSGAFHATRLGSYQDGDWSEIEPSIESAFSALASHDLARNDLFEMVSNRGRGEHFPDLYFNCGLDDPFIEANRDLHELLVEQEVPHRFDELPGGHDWAYWNSSVCQFVEKLDRDVRGRSPLA